MLKRLDGPDAEQFHSVVDDENTIVVVDGVPYLIARLPLLNEVGLEIEGNINLKASIRRAKDDIRQSRVYTTEEAFKLLDEGLTGDFRDSLVA